MLTTYLFSNRKTINLVTLIVIVVMATLACQPSTSTLPETHTATAVSVTIPTPTVQVIPTNTPIPPTVAPSPTPVPPLSVWISPGLPADLRSDIVHALTGTDSLIQFVSELGSKTDIQFSHALKHANTSNASIFTRTYAIAAPFPTVADSITLASLIQFWHGDAAKLQYLTNDQSTPRLYVDQETLSGLELIMGMPASTAPIVIVKPSELVDRLWASRPSSFAILPFDRLEVRLKLMMLDGLNLFEKATNMGDYPLRLIVTGNYSNLRAKKVVAALPASDNREVSKLAIVAMTGTTAMVRGTAVQMERKGLTYPGEAIRDWMLTADIRHVSNEVSFWDECPPPTFDDGVSMCSNPKYIDLLKYMGVNVVELSGNHLWDKGSQYLSPTISLYKSLGWGVFAGGRTYSESIQPLTMTVAGNKLAFVGCNWFGSDWATEENGVAGSALCGLPDPRSLNMITATIHEMTSQGYTVIAAIQYQEYYQYDPYPQQEGDFKILRDAGASIVNGSQGHWVQGFDVSASGFIHYGVGNLFFGDQEGEGTHQMFVDRHAFYDGHYLGVDLRSGYIIDYSRPEPMSLGERQKLLRVLFAATGY